MRTTVPSEGLGDAHAALEEYLLENGLESGGAAIEFYLTDPGEVPDPAAWTAMVHRPIATSARGFRPGASRGLGGIQGRRTLSSGLRIMSPIDVVANRV